MSDCVSRTVAGPAVARSLLRVSAIRGPSTIAERLYDLPREEWDAYTNRGHLELPKAKGASEPYLYRDGPAPVPDGTKISVWYAERGRALSGWWIGTTARAGMWHGVMVFRLRRIESSGAIGELSDLARIANALERIASGIEAQRAAATEIDAVHESPVAESETPSD